MDSKISSPDNQTNFAEAKADTLFTHYSQSDSGLLTAAQTDTFVNGNGGVSGAEAIAQATLGGDPNASELFAQSFGASSDPNTQVKNSSDTKVAASFSVAANQTFSFDFSAEIALAVKDLGHSKTASNEAKSRSKFVVYDISDPNNYKVLDYFGIFGDLSSPNERHKFKIGASDHVKISNRQRPDVNGNGDTESLASNVSGTYQRTFDHATNIAVVEIDDTSIAVTGDALTGARNNQDDLTHGGDRGNFVVTQDDLKAGQTEINNFDPGKDQVDIQGVGNSDTSAWLGSHQPRDTDKGALLEVSPGHSVLFRGVHAGDLNGNNVHTH